MKAKEIVDSVVESSVGDYSMAFKLLGFLSFLAEEGSGPFLAGNVLTPRTYHRWLENLRQSGLEALALDVRLRQLVREYTHSRFAGLPIDKARSKVLDTVCSIIGEEEALPLQAQSRQASEAVKSERSETEGREAQPSALDGGADGGSLSGVGAPQPRINA
jgi:hypothetical protein